MSAPVRSHVQAAPPRSAAGAEPATPRRVDPLGFLPLREFFSLDLRSLAVLRICLALLLLSDWIDRLPDLRAHYSDDGIVPRDVLSGMLPLSVHFFSGSLWYQAVLLAVACGFAVLLLVGRWTPFATLASWFLLISVHGRNPALLQGGDILLRMLLFWGIFLPLGACYSVDSARAGARPASFRWLSPGTVAYVVQLCVVYWYAAAWKWGPEWREHGTAVWYALKAEHFTTRFGKFLLDYPDLLRLLTYGSLYLETLGPALLFVPFAPPLMRLLAIAGFAAFHVGLALTLELGNFPWVCIAAWLALLPTAFWDFLARWLHRPERSGLTLYYDADNPRALRALSRLRTFLLLYESRLAPAQDQPGLLDGLRKQGTGLLVVDHRGNQLSHLDALAYLLRVSPLGWPLARLVYTRLGRALAGSWSRRLAAPVNRRARAVEGEEAPERPAWAPPGGVLAGTAVLFCLVYVVLLNIRTFNMERNKVYFPNQIIAFAYALGLDQGWGLFAPAPGKIVGWYVVVGTQKDGTQVDLLRGGKTPVDYSKPELLSATYSNGRWRKLMMNLPLNDSFPYLLPGFARYEMQEWDRRHAGAQQLKGVDVYWFREVTVPPGAEQPPPQRGVFHYPRPDHGLPVVSLLPDGSAARADIRPDDILLDYGRVRLETPDDLVKALRTPGEGKRTLTVWRDGETRALEVEPGPLGVIVRPHDAPGPLMVVP